MNANSSAADVGRGSSHTACLEQGESKCKCTLHNKVDIRYLKPKEQYSTDAITGIDKCVRPLPVAM